MPHLVEAGYLSDERPKADCCQIRQRTLIFRLRLYLIGTFNVVSRYGWLLQLPNPRRNQYKPWFICLHVLTINEYAEVGKLQRICYYKWDAGVMSRGDENFTWDIFADSLQEKSILV